MKQRKPNISRTGERLIRMAYDLEHIAVRLREAGRDSDANGVKALASRMGNIGRDLEREIPRRYRIPPQT